MAKPKVNLDYIRGFADGEQKILLLILWIIFHKSARLKLSEVALP